MKFRLQLVRDAEDGTVPDIADILMIDRDDCHLGNLGLKLEDAKRFLANLQDVLVRAQLDEYTSKVKPCAKCRRNRHCKDYGNITFRSLFGNVIVRSPRLVHCSCFNGTAKTFSPLSELLPEHTAPELLYLEAKWGSLAPYTMASNLLKDVLPISATTNSATLRNHTLKVARKLESEMGEEQSIFATGSECQLARLPHPDGPITVGIDGTYIRDWSDKKRQFEVIVGKSIPHEGDSKCFGFVQTFDKKPKRRLFDVLDGQGMQMNQQVIFLSDGGEDLQDLQLYMNPQSEHILDWFHITMRLTVLKNCSTGIKAMNQQVGEEALKYVESAKWYLWHGNVRRALDEVESLYDCLDPDLCNGDDVWSDAKKPQLEKIQEYVDEFKTYIERNAGSLVNYGERYRAGERISTGFTESAVNYVVNKRFSKRQQMQWTQAGAHLLLQTRTRVLNGDLEKVFERWYPDVQAA